jgi:hypothetical protein
VIGFVETIKSRPVHAEQPRLPVCRIKPVEIDQKAHHAIAEAMADRLQTRMHYVAEIERGRGVIGAAMCC